ncbi:MAG TPA: guanylate kinase [Steroidobacteraceae bacterium]|jgi:guanylate kinase|nr:guanylate kinase [Steroidobacteraceae bacterium]
MKRTVLASGNAGKLKELTAILAPLGLELIAQSALRIDSPPETGTTFLENALIKARHAARVSGLPALADDSGIEVDALDGRPGVRSARFAGDGASDADNLHKLLAELHDVPMEFRQARYHCVIAFVRRHDDGQPIVAHGTWEGRIALEPRGSGGFGYDPIFLPSLPKPACPSKPAGRSGAGRRETHPPCTAAELDPSVKNELSHRAQALRAWVAAAREELDLETIRTTPTTRGTLFVLAAPSGAGKTSLVKALLERMPGLQMSVSHTTRPRRPTEEHGREYYFVTVPEFERLVADGQFLEHARVFDNLYGTARAPVEIRLAQGGDVVLEIDWQGARLVRSAMPDCVTIFILPPSREALEKRLRSRATDSPEVIVRRLRDAVSDMSHWREFDYVVVNDDFEKAVADLVAIVSAHGERVPADARAGGGPQRRVLGGAGRLAAGRAELAPLLARLLA